MHCDGSRGSWLEPGSGDLDGTGDGAHRGCDFSAPLVSGTGKPVRQEQEVRERNAHFLE